MSREVRYRIYPSLLDKFQALLDVDTAVEEWWNLDSEGEYKETADQMSDRLEQELLDCINRVQKDPIEAADKGTCFNEVIDCLIHGKKCDRVDMDIYTEEIAGNRVITAKYNGFTFHYDIALCKEVAGILNGAISQHCCSGLLDTKYGVAELYGYADEIVADKVYDIKTTGRYDFGKFAKGWQRHLYPCALITCRQMASCSAFEYLVVVWKGGTKTNPVLSGTIYREYYTFNYEQSCLMLHQICDRFIEWLESHRAQITDKKIFAEE